MSEYEDAARRQLQNTVLGRESWERTSVFRWWQPHKDAPEGRVLQQLWIIRPGGREWRPVDIKFGDDPTSD